MELLAGARIEHYTLLSRLGAGGFSEVWLASDGSGEQRALKFPLVPELVDHLRREAELSDLLAGDLPERIVGVEAAHLDHDPPYLVMPYVDGEPMPASPGDPPPHRAIADHLRQVKQAAHLLDALHDLGVVHGDIKPQNILVDASGTCWLVDLGLAAHQLRTRQQRSLAQSLVSVDGRAMGGTLEYMAPELLDGGQPSPASDLFGLGMILHLELTGRMPSFGVPPSAIQPLLPPGTDALVQDLLARDPRHRPQADQVIERLERLILEEKACLSTYRGHQRRFERQARQRSGSYLTTFVVFLLLVIAGVVALEAWRTGVITLETWRTPELVLVVLGTLSWAVILIARMEHARPAHAAETPRLPDLPMRASAVSSTSSTASGEPLYSGHRLVRRIGEGNFCEVWLAEALAAHDIVVKIARDEVGERMLRSEAEAARQLAGIPGVVPVSELVHEPRPHVLMPHVRGRTARQHLEAIRDDDDERGPAVALFLRLLRVVDEVHRRGVVHGDLKPENILVDDAGQPHLIDFGLARLRQANRRDQSLVHSLASTGDLSGGTLDYMPPEEVQGGEPTQLGDIYALGVMLHEFLLGRRPDIASSAERLGELLPDETVSLLLRCLSHDAARRPSSAGVLLRSLQPAAPALTATGAAREYYTLKRLLTRSLGAQAYRVAAMLAGSGFLALVLTDSC